MRRIFAFAIIAWTLLAGLSARAAEEILSYASRIEVATNGDLNITETIVVRAEGNRIKRGIYRDFPLRFKSIKGEINRVSFDVQNVTRDGQVENWSTESNGNFVRLRIGNPEVMLSHSDHIYEIRYTTDRQIRFFDDYDELNWNAIGKGWEIPILQASALVVLPKGAKTNEVSIQTDAFGAPDENARGQINKGGEEVVFATTLPLPPGAGMTIAVKIPKGYIAPPTLWQTLTWYLRDHLGSVLAIAGLLIAAIYYSRSWLKVGVDPEGGTIVPRWDMPEGVSPALVHYIDNKGYHGDPWRPISASVLSLAVKGQVKLEDLKSDMVIQATGKGITEKLPSGEAQVMRQVEAAGGTLRMDKANGTRIASMQSAFATAMESEHRSNYYKANTGYIIAGIAFSILVFAATLNFGDIDETGIFALVILVIAGVIITILITRWAKAHSETLWGKIKLIIGTAIASFVLVSIGGIVLANSPTPQPAHYCSAGLLLWLCSTFCSFS